MRAAQEASRRGARVALVCHGSGASPYVHGLNIPVADGDSVECFLADTLKSGKYLNQRNLAEILCKESKKLLEEFSGDDPVGLSFDRDDEGYMALKSLGASYPRVVGIRGMTGAALLGDIRRENGFLYLSGVRAMRLVTESNRICGAYCRDLKRKRWFFAAAKAVILACGGFGGIFGFTTNPGDIGGDGIAMAYQAGAKLVDMEFIQFEPSAAVAPKALRGKSVITTMLHEGAVLRNGLGQPFLPETEELDKDMLSQSIFRELKAGRGTEAQGVYLDATGVGKKVLYQKYGSYVKRYLDAGVDITKEPMEIAPAPHTTLGGVLIDERCQSGVEGLFACGEAAGGVHGANRLGGNAGLEILVFGKIAGRQAADYALRNACGKKEKPERAEEIRQSADREPEGLRARLQQILSDSLNVERNGRNMKKGLQELAELMERTRVGTENPAAALDGAEGRNAFSQGSFLQMRLYHDCLTAYLSLSAALERKQSIGVHQRTDSEKEDTGYHIIIERDPVHGLPVLTREPVEV